MSFFIENVLMLSIQAYTSSADQLPKLYFEEKKSLLLVGLMAQNLLSLK